MRAAPRASRIRLLVLDVDGVLTDGGLVFSTSGEETKRFHVHDGLAMVAARRAGLQIAILSSRASAAVTRRMAELGVGEVHQGVAEEACPMNLAPTSSTTAALAMGDALAMTLLDLRGLGPDDYAALHPRGSLGWKALFKVSDLMHTGPALPLISEEATMKEAIEEMSGKGLGMTTVVDAGGRLVGVVTDGDLRRQQLSHGASLLERRAAECMTRGPKVIGGADLAAKALAMMEGRITSLVIVDAAGRPAGVIHLHDILRAKIV